MKDKANIKEGFFWGCAALIFVSIFIFVILSFGAIHKKSFPDVEFVNRKYAILIDKEALRKRDSPFLMKISLHSESRTQALFDVTYFIPKNDTGTYSLVVYPDSSNFVSAPNHLKTGENIVRIAVDFSPASFFVRGKKTEYINIYIYKQNPKPDFVTGEILVTKIYERRVVFSKHWRKPKRAMGSIGNTKFHWK